RFKAYRRRAAAHAGRSQKQPQADCSPRDGASIPGAKSDAGLQIDATLSGLGGAGSVQAGRRPVHQIERAEKHRFCEVLVVTANLTCAGLPTACRNGPIRTAADTRRIDFRLGMVDRSAKSGSRCAFYPWSYGRVVLAGSMAIRQLQTRR